MLGEAAATFTLLLKEAVTMPGIKQVLSPMQYIWHLAAKLIYNKLLTCVVGLCTNHQLRKGVGLGTGKSVPISRYSFSPCLCLH